jgi:hypothetical protein
MAGNYPSGYFYHGLGANQTLHHMDDGWPPSTARWDPIAEEWVPVGESFTLMDYFMDGDLEGPIDLPPGVPAYPGA